jgi:hypothetical protein
MADLKLKIYDATNGLDFEIPLDSDKNSPFSLSKQLADLTDLTRRFGVQSYTFKVPISKDISDNFDFFNQSQHHNYKDVDGDKTCVILVDDEEIERGKIRITNFFNTDGFEEVEMLFYGSNYDWKEQIKDMTLADLPFVNNSILYTPTTIKNSWTNTVDTAKEWVFPLENRGGRKLPNAIHTEDFRPAIFFHTILTLTLKSIGYTFTSAFMDSVAFKRLVITHFGKRFGNSADIVNGTIFKAEKIYKTNTDNNNTGTAYPADVIINLRRGFNVQGGTGIFRDLYPLNIGRYLNSNATGLSMTWEEKLDNGLHFNPIGGLAIYDLWHNKNYYPGRYTATVQGVYNVKVKANGYYNNTGRTGGSGVFYGNFYNVVFLKKYDSSGVSTQPTSGTSMENTISSTLVQTLGLSWFSFDNSVDIQLNVGESFEVWRVIDNSVSGSGHNYLEVSYLNCYVEATLLSKKSEGDTFNLTDVCDNEVKILDIINDVSRLFNLYFDTDTVLKKITIEPRDSYYKEIEDAVEYTDYIDVGKPIKTVYNSSFHKKNYNFSYAEDSADAFVVGRNKQQSSKLAQYKHVLPSKFQDGTTEISTSVLAATYVARDEHSLNAADVAFAPLTARYWNKYSETMPIETLDDHAPRLLEYVYEEQGNGTDLYKFQFYDEPTPNFNYRTDIPSVLPYLPFDGTNYLTGNIFNLYWHNIGVQAGLFESKYGSTMAEIINGTKCSLSMWVDQKLWKQFSFRNVIYIDEPIEIKGYWVVEILENYQPERSSLLRVDLLRKENYEPQHDNGSSFLEYPPLTGNERISYDTNPMLFLAEDGDGNTIKIAMTGLDTNGNESTLNS